MGNREGAGNAGQSWGGWGRLAAHLGQAHSLRAAVGVVSRGVPDLWAASAALSASSCQSESHSWPGWQSARWLGCQSSRSLQRPGWTRDGGQRGCLPLGFLARGVLGAGCALAGAGSRRRWQGSPEDTQHTWPGLRASGDGALIPYLGFALRRLPMWSWGQVGPTSGGPGPPSHQDACLLWALMPVSPLPPLRPLFICDRVCPYDCVCAALSCLFFHLSLLLPLSLSVSLLLVSPKTIRNT